MKYKHILFLFIFLMSVLNLNAKVYRTVVDGIYYRTYCNRDKTWNDWENTFPDGYAIQYNDDNGELYVYENYGATYFYNLKNKINITFKDKGKNYTTVKGFTFDEKDSNNRIDVFILFTNKQKSKIHSIIIKDKTQETKIVFYKKQTVTDRL